LGLVWKKNKELMPTSTLMTGVFHRQSRRCLPKVILVMLMV
jgi:hypothetical protein